MPIKDGINQVKRLVHVPEPIARKSKPGKEASSTLPAAPRAREAGRYKGQAPVSQQPSGSKGKAKAQKYLDALPPYESDWNNVHLPIFYLEDPAARCVIPGIVAEACLESLQEWFSSNTLMAFKQPERIIDFLSEDLVPLKEVQAVLRRLEATHRQGRTLLSLQADWEKAVLGVITHMAQPPISRRSQPQVRMPWLVLAELRLEEICLAGVANSKKSYYGAFQKLRSTEVWADQRKVVAAALRKYANRPGATEVDTIVYAARTSLPRNGFSGTKAPSKEPATKRETLLKGGQAVISAEQRLNWTGSDLLLPEAVLRTLYDTLVPSYCAFDPPLTDFDEFRDWVAPAKPELMGLWRVLKALESGAAAGSPLAPFQQTFAEAVVEVISVLVELNLFPSDLGMEIRKRPPELPWQEIAGWLLDRRAPALARRLPWTPQAVQSKIRSVDSWQEECARVGNALQWESRYGSHAAYLRTVIDESAVSLLRAAGLNIPR